MLESLGGEERDRLTLPKWAPSQKPGAAEGTQPRGTWQSGGENLRSKKGDLDYEFPPNTISILTMFILTMYMPLYGLQTTSASFKFLNCKRKRIFGNMS